MEQVRAGLLLADRYELTEPVDQGGMATVWEATDRVLERPVAVKILHEHLADDEGLLDRFRAEATASARLNHPNIVNVFDTGQEDGVAYIVMELFSGETLKDVIDREGSLPSERAIDVVLPVLDALQFAHEAGIVHRDVKPANIMVGGDGRTKVTDFGIAKAMTTAGDPTTTGSVLGSVPYMSPEQVEGREIDPRSDVYSCGALLYHLLTGRPPFQADTDIAAAMMRLTKDPMPPRAVRPGIPRSLDAVVMRGLARHPADRFATAEDMATALRRLRPPTGSVAPLAQPAGAGPRQRPQPAAAARRRSGVFRSWMLVPFLALLVAGAVIVLALRLASSPDRGRKGGEGSGTRPHASPAALTFADTAIEDPFGNGDEHQEDLPNIDDGDPSTYWETEGYSQDFAGESKPGVGVLFDLGAPRSVDGFRLTSPIPGFSFKVAVSGDPESLTRPSALQDLAGRTFVAKRVTSGSIQESRGRYVLLWITEIVPDGGGDYRAEVSEFQVLGSRG
jgi:serine/threonine-protein kinase